MSDKKTHGEAEKEIAKDKDNTLHPVKDSELEKVSGGEQMERAGSRYGLWRFFR